MSNEFDQLVSDTAGKRVDAYLATIKRLEPDIAPVDLAAAAASVAISLRRIADGLALLAKPPMFRIDAADAMKVRQAGIVGTFVPGQGTQSAVETLRDAKAVIASLRDSDGDMLYAALYARMDALELTGWNVPSTPPPLATRELGCVLTGMSAVRPEGGAVGRREWYALQQRLTEQLKEADSGLYDRLEAEGQIDSLARVARELRLLRGDK